MPTYDYECGACGHTYELYQPITAKPVRKCPVCGKARAKRLIGTGAGIIFRGSGFYATDYRSDNYKASAKAEKETVSGSSKSNGDGAAKTKTDAPTSTKPDKPGKKTES